MPVQLSRREAIAVIALTFAVGAAALGVALTDNGGRSVPRLPHVMAATRPSGGPTVAPVSVTSPPAPTSIAIENTRTGTPGWTVQHPSTNGQIEGYVDHVSAQVGDTVTLYVNTTAPYWVATAYRMGWYGGVLARQVWRSPAVSGVRQGPAELTPGINLVQTRWAPSLAVHITPDWTPGDYLFKLLSSTGWDTYVPLTVRDDASAAPILVVNAVTTWEAYNLWGNEDLYAGHAGRADVVTFDRPYRLGDGSGDFLGSEEKLVKLIEGAGLDVTYTTDVDLASRPQVLLHHHVVVSLGHDEYYSTAMRDALETARDHGVNLVFLGANAIYRHIRLQSSALGPDRQIVNYRVAANDPDRTTDPAEVTVQWRDAPVNRPESTLLGEMYQCNPVRTDMVVTDPTAWLWAGTGVVAGQHLPGLIGAEYDHWSSADSQPPGGTVELVAQSPVTCRGHASTADFTYYVAPSGAGVIDTGTSSWVPSTLDDPRIGALVAQVTLTVLRTASTGPLGAMHRAHSTRPVPGGSGFAPAGD
jgi:hypothetical protein